MTKKEINKLFKDSHFYVDIFGVNVNFANNKDDFLFLQKHFNLDESRLMGGRCTSFIINETGEFRLLIGLFVDDQTILAHECVHGALFIMEHIGQSLTYNDELLPYLVSLLMEQCNLKIKR